ncbi:TetR/AcrR family transcriptional regulator [Spirillospora sp. CA-294931]|uniref:TetR/AcrR family transcriptional regulator n=1 Tax=Spirillospora sp. CA-294931 TaxID=3240042 RepID=UPI003D9351F0
MASVSGEREAAPRRRLGRAERREQILAAATRAFVREGGYSGTGLDDIARAAGVSRMILYRHFESKHDLYQAAIDRAAAGLHGAATGEAGRLGESSVPAMMAWAGSDPDAFRLMFRHALREPEFQAEATAIRASMAAALGAQIPSTGTAPAWERWVARLATSMVIEGILVWLDEGAPDPEDAPDRLLRAIDGVYQSLPT